MDAPAYVAEFVRSRIPDCEVWDDRYEAIGLEDGGQLVAGAIFDQQSQTNICVHIAADPGSRWLTTDFVRAVFAYVFGQLQLERVTALTSADNVASLKLQRALGFKEEGRMRNGAGPGKDLIISGMLRRECRYWSH